MNLILQTLFPLAKLLSAVLGCAEAHLQEMPDAEIELSLDGEPQPGSLAPMKLTIEVEFIGPQEFAACVAGGIDPL